MLLLVLITIHNDITSIEQSSQADFEIALTKLSHKKGDMFFGVFYCQRTHPIETIKQL